MSPIGGFALVAPLTLTSRSVGYAVGESCIGEGIKGYEVLRAGQWLLDAARGYRTADA